MPHSALLCFFSLVLMSVCGSNLVQLFHSTDLFLPGCAPNKAAVPNTNCEICPSSFIEPDVILWARLYSAMLAYLFFRSVQYVMDCVYLVYN